MQFIDPQNIIRTFRPKEGEIVADFGSGSGFYALAAAKAVGQRGKVYAVDIQKDLLTRLKSEAHHQHLSNIEAICGDVEKAGGTKLADGSVNDAIVSNILFQANDKAGLAREAGRILKKNGRLLVIDWKNSFSGMGPPPSAIVPLEKAKKLFLDQGFELGKEIEAGDHHYGIIFSKL